MRRRSPGSPSSPGNSQPPGAGLERQPYPPAAGPAGDRRQGLAGDAGARADPALARRAARPEGSILKLFGSELALRIADFSSTCSAPTRLSTRRPKRCPTPCAGASAYSAPANTRSPAAPARSSATSSASACWGCRKGERWTSALAKSRNCCATLRGNPRCRVRQPLRAGAHGRAGGGHRRILAQACRPGLARHHLPGSGRGSGLGSSISWS